MTRDEAVEELEQRLSTLRFIGGSYVDCVNGEALDMAIEALKQPEQKKGKWIRCENPMYSPFDDSGEYTFRCTVCYKKNNEQARYCPNCGAKMEGEQ